MCDFYDNIWRSQDDESQVLTKVATATGVRTARRRRNSQKHRLIDISQVSHVLTTVLDFRSEYPNFTSERINIWSVPGNASYLTDDEGERSHTIVSPIHSQQPMRFPKSAPQLRLSMVADDALDEVDEEESVNGPSEPEREETPEQDAESSFASSAAIQPELKRGKSIVEGKTKIKSKKRQTVPLPAPPLSEDSAVPPPSVKNGSVIFSSVFHEVHDRNWSIRFLLGIHEPIRHALYVTDRFLEQSLREQQIETLEYHTSEFFTWFKTYFVEYVLSQHEVKVKVLLPLLKLRHSTKQEILRSYDEIHDLLAHIQQQKAYLVAPQRHIDRSTWLVRLDTLQKGIRRLNMTLHAVLNLEEKDLHSAMSSAFNEQTFQSHVMPRLFRAIKNKKIVIPWIVERSKVWGGDAEQQSFQGMLPMTSRFMYKKIWRPYFMSNVAVAMNHLNEFDLAAAHTQDRREIGCVMQ